MSAPREVAESYWAAECRRDIDAVMTHTIEPDAVLTDHQADRPPSFSGPTDVR